MSDTDTDFKLIIKTSIKLKDVMFKKGLKAARTPCPMCAKLDPPGEGMIFGRLIPNRRFKYGQALHMKCNGPCKSMMME